MGFAMKDGGDAEATIGDAEFGLIAKGTNAWVKNPAEESHFIDAMKKGSKLIVKAASSKGKVSTDTYSLAGLVTGAGQSAQGMPVTPRRIQRLACLPLVVDRNKLPQRARQDSVFRPTSPQGRRTKV